jgi:hypothetical protein
MIAYFLNFFAGNQAFLLMAFVLASILYLIYSYSHMYNVKINFKNFCLNSDFFKINIDSPSCQPNAVQPPVVQTPVVSVTPASPVGGNILPNVANIPVKTVTPTSTSTPTK